MGKEIKSLKTDTGSVRRKTTKISPLPFTDYAIDRWVPYDIDYKRLNINNFLNEPFDIKKKIN
jgi:hypothetical protein